jgi:GTPase SAR1 family protein
MAFVDLAKDQLILKVVLAGPPAVGKSTRLEQLSKPEAIQSFGSHPAGKTQMATVFVEAPGTTRQVLVEIYEWHGHEKADVRRKTLFTGLDGLFFIVDAREDRYQDTKNTYEFLMKEAGRSRITRLPGLRLLGQKDQGLLRLRSFKSVFKIGPKWVQSLEENHDCADELTKAIPLFADAMLRRMV